MESFFVSFLEGYGAVGAITLILAFAEGKYKAVSGLIKAIRAARTKKVSAEIQTMCSNIEDNLSGQIKQSEEHMLAALEKSKAESIARHEANKRGMEDVKREAFKRLEEVRSELAEKIDYNKRESDFKDDAIHADDVRLNVKKLVAKMRNEGYEPKGEEAGEYWYMCNWYINFCEQHHPGDDVEFEYDNEKMVVSCKYYMDWYEQHFMKLASD